MGNRPPIFYYITDRKHLPEGALIRCIRRAIRWGVDFIQIREKDLPDRALFELTLKSVALAAKGDSKILVNGRADLALAARAAGVHLPSSGIKVADIRAWAPDDFLIGVSVHSPREAREACRQGADYVLLGPVYATESKIGYGPPLGLERLQQACRSVSVPILGLGGIGPAQIRPVLETGAVGVAGIGLFQGSDFRALTRVRTVMLRPHYEGSRSTKHYQRI